MDYHNLTRHLILQFIESLWSNKFIDNIQISLLEKQGVGTRGEYYENSGAMRDMVQNHVMQILSLVAMEPPVNLKTDAIRTEKLKVIQAIEEFTPELLRDNAVFGQYGKGIIDGMPVPAYRDEEKVPKNSNTETFVALKLHINNFLPLPNTVPEKVCQGFRCACYFMVVIQNCHHAD